MAKAKKTITPETESETPPEQDMDPAELAATLAPPPAEPTVQEAIVEAALAVASDEVPATEWWRVERSGHVAIDGSLHTIHQGSIVSAITHDLAALHAAGIALSPSGAPRRPLDAYGDPL